MATHTLGTNANNSLTSLTFSAGADMLDADIASICAGIADDSNPTAPVIPGSFLRSGLLFIPRRGVLKVLPGDVVAFDPTAGVLWPILVSKQAIANGAWHFV